MGTSAPDSNGLATLVQHSRGPSTPWHPNTAHTEHPDTVPKTMRVNT